MKTFASFLLLLLGHLAITMAHHHHALMARAAEDPTPELREQPEPSEDPEDPEFPVDPEDPEQPELTEQPEFPELPLIARPEFPELPVPEVPDEEQPDGFQPGERIDERYIGPAIGPAIEPAIQPAILPYPRPPPRPLPPYGFSNCKEAPRLYGVQQIDAGLGMVVARSNRNRAFFLSGSSWYSLGPLNVRHVSVGPAGIWGADTRNRVYKYVAGNFRAAPGVSMLQVDAGGDGHVVGVSTSSFRTYCVRSFTALAYSGVGSLSWSPLAMSMRYYSCGPYSCWGVDTRFRVYVTQKIDPNSCGNGAWRQVPGISARMVEVGTDGSVYAVTTGGQVYQRTGVYRGRAYGTSWIQVPMCMAVRHVSYDLGQLWVVTNSGLLLQCSRSNMIRPEWRTGVVA